LILIAVIMSCLLRPCILPPTPFLKGGEFKVKAVSGMTVLPAVHPICLCNGRHPPRARTPHLGTSRAVKDLRIFSNCHEIYRR
jgi:hypothetical protein